MKIVEKENDSVHNSLLIEDHMEFEFLAELRPEIYNHSLGIIKGVIAGKGITQYAELIVSVYCVENRTYQIVCNLVDPNYEFNFMVWEQDGEIWTGSIHSD